MQDSCGPGQNRQNYANNGVRADFSGSPRAGPPGARHSLRDRAPRRGGGGGCGTGARTAVALQQRPSPPALPVDGPSINAKALTHHTLESVTQRTVRFPGTPIFAAPSLNTSLPTPRPPCHLRGRRQHDSASRIRSDGTEGRRHPDQLGPVAGGRRCRRRAACRRALAVQRVAGQLRVGRVSEPAADPRPPPGGPTPARQLGECVSVRSVTGQNSATH